MVLSRPEYSHCRTEWYFGGQKVQTNTCYNLDKQILIQRNIEYVVFKLQDRMVLLRAESAELLYHENKRLIHFNLLSSKGGPKFIFQNSALGRDTLGPWSILGYIQFGNSQYHKMKYYNATVVFQLYLRYIIKQNAKRRFSTRRIISLLLQGQL